MANASDAVLSSTVKELIADGMVSRQQFDEIPPRVAGDFASCDH